LQILCGRETAKNPL